MATCLLNSKVESLLSVNSSVNNTILIDSSVLYVYNIRANIYKNIEIISRQEPRLQ